MQLRRFAVIGWDSVRPAVSVFLLILRFGLGLRCQNFWTGLDSWRAALFAFLTEAPQFGFVPAVGLEENECLAVVHVPFPFGLVVAQACGMVMQTVFSPIVIL